MENNNEYVKKISDKLDNIITKGFEINRNNILEAEDIKYNKSTINSETYDEFGFLDKYKDKNEINFHKALTEDEELKIDAQQNLRILKWGEMLENYDKYKLSNFSKLKERTRKGIPDSMRGIAWINLAGIKEFKKGKENLYKELIQNIKNENFIDKKEEDVIIRDLHRTFPKSIIFSAKLGEGQRNLFKILMCAGVTNRTTGYVQGMGFLAALFLFYMDEENAFWMLNCLFKKYGLEEVYKKDFPGLRKRFYVLIKLIEKFMPKVYNKLIDFNVYPTMYASQWFFTCFSNCLSFNVVVRIFDCYLLEGEKIIYRVALALFKLKEKFLVNAKSFEKLMEGIKSITNEIKDPDQLLKIGFDFSLSREHIKNLEKDYENLAKIDNNKLNVLLGY
jgi:hypothetical protein